MYAVWLEGESRERCWYVGMPVPVDSDELHLVKMIHADGDELQHIEHLLELPARTSMQRWHDVEAQWILAILASDNKRKTIQLGPYSICIKK